MKEGVNRLAPSAFTSPKQPLATYTRDIISNAPAIKYYEQTPLSTMNRRDVFDVFACTSLHRKL